MNAALELYPSCTKKQRIVSRLMDAPEEIRPIKKRNFLSARSRFPFARNVLGLMSWWNLRDWEFRPVQTADELRQASALVYKEYLKNDYIAPNSHGEKLALFQLLSSTVTFVAFHKKKLVGTLTLVEDSPLGLPMDAVYRDAIDELRGQKRGVAECTMLAFDRQELKRIHSSKSVQIMVLMHFFAHMFDYVRSQTHLTDLIACYHPRHDLMYEFLQFKPFGKLALHGDVKGNPAVARRLKISDFRNGGQNHVAYKLFFPRREKRPIAIPAVDGRDPEVRKLFNVHPESYLSATPEQLEFLAAKFPNFEPEYRLFVGDQHQPKA